VADGDACRVNKGNAAAIDKARVKKGGQRNQGPLLQFDKPLVADQLREIPANAGRPASCSKS
jgi:hypothetical protein